MCSTSQVHLAVSISDLDRGDVSPYPLTRANVPETSGGDEVRAD